MEEVSKSTTNSTIQRCTGCEGTQLINGEHVCVAARNLGASFFRHASSHDGPSPMASVVVCNQPQLAQSTD